MIGFQDHGKMDETSNVTLPLIGTDIITNHSVEGILVDDGSSCKLMYLIIFRKLELHIQDLKPCEGMGLIEYNESLTQLCRTVDLPVSFGILKDKRILNMDFSMISCESVYNNIFGKSFLAMLDVVAFLVH